MSGNPEPVGRDRYDIRRLRRLLNMPNASSDELAPVLAKRLRIPFIDMPPEFQIDAKLIRMVPEKLCRRYCLIPVDCVERISVTVAMLYPMDMEAIDAVQSATGLEVRKAVGSETQITRALDRFYSSDAFVRSDLQNLVMDDAIPEDAEQVVEKEETGIGEDVANQAPVVKFVNLVLMTALKEGASDIHFEPGEGIVRLRLRIDGRLQEITPPAVSMYNAVVARLKILSKMDISERRVPQDGRFKFRAGGRTIDLRVNTLPEVHGEKVVMRLLDRSTLKTDLGDIGFEGKTLTDFQRILALPHGIILVTGPTGSGKSTTLYGALGYVNNPELNIQTVEDPVEYQLKGINQCAIRSEIGMSFASALRAILRQDPDIIMVGEIRDRETAEIAMRAALTGHLVLSTLHTNDATSTFTRMLDMGIEDFLISTTVKMVLAQRLIRRLCNKCKVQHKLTEDQRRFVISQFPDAGDWTYYEPKGCVECGNRGYKGRCAIFEFLEVTPPIGDIIRPGISNAEIRKVAIQEGMETLTQNALRRVKEGVSTVEEVIRTAGGGH
jgi:type IV pilus assembly protein PilB